MNQATIKKLSMMICALGKVLRVAYSKLASEFDREALTGFKVKD
jgi:hypothetical protein